MEDANSSAKELNHSENCKFVHFVENLIKLSLTLWWLTLIKLYRHLICSRGKELCVIKANRLTLFWKNNWYLL
jgi:hypothetical protein